jgi:hypothetical protein
VESVLPAGTSLTINGVAVKQAVIDTTLQNWIAIFKAVDTAKAAYQSAVTARLGITVAARTYYKALKAALKLQFGPQSPLLASFGISVDKPGVTSTKTRLVAAAKRNQTRALRGTKGKNQRAAIVVVGDPPVTVASDGTVQSGPPTLNVPAGDALGSPLSSSSGNAPVSTPASSAPLPAAASGAGNAASSAPAGQ